MTKILSIVTIICGLTGAILGVVNICRKPNLNKAETKDKWHIIIAIIILICAIISIILNSIVVVNK